MKFHRGIGEFAGGTYSVTGERLSPEDYEKHVAEALPNEKEKTFIRDLMKEPGLDRPPRGHHLVGDCPSRVSDVVRIGRPRTADPTPLLVSARAATASVAGNPRPVPDLGLRGDAPADHGQSRARALSARSWPAFPTSPASPAPGRKAFSPRGRASAITRAPEISTGPPARSPASHGGPVPAGSGPPARASRLRRLHRRRRRVSGVRRPACRPPTPTSPACSRASTLSRVRTGSPALARSVLGVAARLLPRARPGDLTAALMDLGQQICTPRRPDCGACPVAGLCVARARGMVERYPQRKPKPRARRVFFAAACAVREGRVLLVQRPGALLEGLWRFPSAEGATPRAALAALRLHTATLGLRLDAGPPVGVTQHTIVNRRLDVRVYRAGSNGAAPATRNSGSARWFSPAALEAGAVPTLTRKIARAAGFPENRGRRILEIDESRRGAVSARGAR